MAKKWTFKLNSDGVVALLKCGEMQSLLSQLGNQKAAQAGAGYASDVHVYKKRAVANIHPNDAESANDNYENNTLLKVIGGG